MAINSVNATDDEPVPFQWQVDPAGPQQRSPIPRGLITFSGTDATVTKDAGDETAYRLILTMPTGFAYLPRRAHLIFTSDDLTEGFNSVGSGLYQRFSIVGDSSALVTQTQFSLDSVGQAIILAATATRLWTPAPGSPKLLLGGSDRMILDLVDMSAGATTAGDMVYQFEFYVFDTDQIDKWQVNTPIPVINHASF